MGTLENAAPHRFAVTFLKIFFNVEMLSVQFTSKPPRETLISCENQCIKAFGLLTWEFAFPLSEIAMQMQLVTWQNLTSKVNKKKKNLIVILLIFSCDQAALRTLLSVRLSVPPSVCYTFFTMFLSSYHPEIFRSYYHWQMWCPCRRSRSQRSRHNLSVSGL